jgi:hypothetical protein
MTISEWPACSSLSKRRAAVRDVLEVQAGGGLVEQEEQPGFTGGSGSLLLPRQLGGFRQVARPA